MKPHALVIDDEETIHRVLEKFLTLQGFRVTAAMSSAAVQRHVGKHAFALVILDVDLGGEYGLGLLPLFCNAKPPPPVIVYSGVGADSEVAALARAKGAFAFVSKADPLEVLGAVIQRAVPTANGTVPTNGANSVTATKPASTAPAARGPRAARR